MLNTVVLLNLMHPCWKEALVALKNLSDTNLLHMSVLLIMETVRNSYMNIIGGQIHKLHYNWDGMFDLG